MVLYKERCVGGGEGSNVVTPEFRKEKCCHWMFIYPLNVGHTIYKFYKKRCLNQSAFWPSRCVTPIVFTLRVCVCLCLHSQLPFTLRLRTHIWMCFALFLCAVYLFIFFLITASTFSPLCSASLFRPTCPPLSILPPLSLFFSLSLLSPYSFPFPFHRFFFLFPSSFPFRFYKGPNARAVIRLSHPPPLDTRLI